MQVSRKRRYFASCFCATFTFCGLKVGFQVDDLGIGDRLRRGLGFHSRYRDGTGLGFLMK